MKLYSNYPLYKMPYYYLETIRQLDYMHDGVALLDELWRIVDSRMSRKASNKLVADILARSRKRRLVYIFTAQVIDTIDKRIRKVQDFTCYPMLGRGEKTCKAIIFRTGFAKNANYMKTFYYSTQIPFSTYDSILPDQNVFFFNDEKLHIEPVENLHKYADNYCPYDHMIIPTYNKITDKMENKKANAFMGHHVKKDCYSIEAQFGRKIKTTGDHSLMTYKDGEIQSIPVRELKVNDFVIVPKRFKVKENDIDDIFITDWVKSIEHKGRYKYEMLAKISKKDILKNRKKIMESLQSYDFYRAYKMLYLYKKKGYLPYEIFSEINKKKDMKITSRYLKGFLDNRIKLDSDFLWLLGFFLAEGSSTGCGGKKTIVSFSSEEKHLDKVERIIKRFKIGYTRIRPQKNKGGMISIPNMLLSLLFWSMTRRLEWMLQLPLSKLKWIVLGMWEGDGYHNGKFGNRFSYASNNEEITNFMVYALSRFGIVAGKYRYSYKIKRHKMWGRIYKNKIVSCNRVEASLNNMNILDWDNTKDLQIFSIRNGTMDLGDVVAIRIRKIKKFNYSGMVYDFSVPKTHNFLAGDMIIAKNSNFEVDMIDDTDEENPPKPPKLIWQEGFARCRKCKFVLTMNEPKCPECESQDLELIKPTYYDDWETADKFANQYWENLLKKEGIENADEDGL